MEEIKYDTKSISMVAGYAQNIGGAYQEMMDLLDSAYKKANELSKKYDELKKHVAELQNNLALVSNEIVAYYEIDYENDSEEEIRAKERYNASLMAAKEREIEAARKALETAQKELDAAYKEFSLAYIKAENFYKTVNEFNKYLLVVHNEIASDIDNLNHKNNSSGPTEFSYTQGASIDLSNQSVIVSGAAMDFFEEYGSVDQNGLADLIKQPDVFIFESSYNNEISEIIARMPITNVENKAGKAEVERLTQFAKDKYGLSEDETYVIMRSLNLQGACSYADMCNIIYELYGFDSSKFENDFGYPIVNNNNTLNGNQLLLDLYISQNIEVGNINNSNGNGALLARNTNGSVSLNSIFLILDEQKNIFLDAANQNYMSAGYGDNSNLIHDFEDGAMYQFLQENNSSCISDYESKSYNINDENAREVLNNSIQHGERYSVSMGLYDDFTLYPVDNPTGGIHITEGGHAVTPVGLTEDGVLVRSWGELYYVPYSDVDGFDVIDYMH